MYFLRWWDGSKKLRVSTSLPTLGDRLAPVISQVGRNRSPANATLPQPLCDLAKKGRPQKRWTWGFCVCVFLLWAWILLWDFWTRWTILIHLAFLLGRMFLRKVEINHNVSGSIPEHHCFAKQTYSDIFMLQGNRPVPPMPQSRTNIWRVATCIDSYVFERQWFSHTHTCFQLWRGICSSSKGFFGNFP